MMSQLPWSNLVKPKECEKGIHNNSLSSEEFFINAFMCEATKNVFMS